ncbi:hypothetical protein [Kibdelosporangium philippinense]
MADGIFSSSGPLPPVNDSGGTAPQGGRCRVGAPTPTRYRFHNGV